MGRGGDLTLAVKMIEVTKEKLITKYMLMHSRLGIGGKIFRDAEVQRKRCRNYGAERR